ncbi:DUF6198 family protein [Methanobrevibacter smithii]|jgi:uncharacterized membrane protein YczE|uniref:DUF6198 family protein n=1 Tax=Methanobrevibacter smithii TaxID=2173 RepID=UPI000374A9B4
MIMNGNMIKRISLYVLGLFVMTVGIAFSFRSDLGSSPVSSIPYSMMHVWAIEVGFATILFHIALVILQFLILRENFKAKILLQVVAGVLFGYFTTLAVYLVSFVPKPPGLIGDFIFLGISIVVLAFGIFLYLPPHIVQLAGEGVMQAIAITYDLPFPKVKVGFDAAMVIISVVMCWIFIGNPLASVGIGTIVAAFLVGTVLEYIVKGFKKITDREVDLKQM